MLVKKSQQPLEIRPQMRGGNGEAHLKQLLPQLPMEVRFFNAITLAPGSSIGVHKHVGESELFYFVSGTGRFCDDGDWSEVHPGDATITFAGHSHGLENNGSEDLVLVSAIIIDCTTPQE